LTIGGLIFEPLMAMEKNQQRKRVWIIANRLPFTIEHNDSNELTIRRSSGGLVNALTSYYEQASIDVDKYWVGVADCTPQVWENEIIPYTKDDKVKFHPIFVDEHDYENYYSGFCNATIWPLFHYFPTKVEYHEAYWEAYEKVNRNFAEQLIPSLQPGDLVWIHDYQLMLLPALLREQVADLSIGFFLHIPFPSYELFRMLPQLWKKSIAEGLLGADLIGFHTYEYVQHFIQSMKMVLGVENTFHKIHYQNREVYAELFPLGIDYAKFSEKAVSEEVTEKVNFLKNEFRDKKVIFSVDRLDYSKGFMQRLNGWENFLQEYPEWKEKVVFLIIIVPSRDTIDSYQEMKSAIEEKIGTINGRYGTITWQPIHYQYRHLSFDNLIALYRHADVALITPLRDGMNLVAKEFIASQVNGKGVLVLSELAGAAVELNESLLVNPFDTIAVSDAIHRALSLPLEERIQRNRIMQDRLLHYDVIQWINDFVDQLDLVTSSRNQRKANALNLLNLFVKRYQSAAHRIFLIDYDGTLAPITNYPKDAIPTEAVKNVLRKLASQPNTKVVVISGRPADTLETWLGDLPITLVAEHGSIIKDGKNKWLDTLNLSPLWKSQVMPIMQTFVSRCIGSFVEEKKNTIAWHYRNTLPGVGFDRSRELINNLNILLQNTPLQVIDGNKVVEVKPTGYDKGTMAVRLCQQFQADFVCCLGDDTTDEDMFIALNEDAITIKVKEVHTNAKYFLPKQSDVITFLESFIH
jgi:trehalose 6-phosphate synthase/phosphatase